MVSDIAALSILYLTCALMSCYKVYFWNFGVHSNFAELIKRLMFCNLSTQLVDELFCRHSHKGATYPIVLCCLIVLLPYFSVCSILSIS